MTRHTAREWTVEEFGDWSAATGGFEAVATAAERSAVRAFRWCRPPDTAQIAAMASATIGTIRRRARSEGQPFDRLRADGIGRCWDVHGYWLRERFIVA
jgi:hypothetical protein